MTSRPLANPSEPGWQDILTRSVTAVEDLPSEFGLDPAALQPVTHCYPMGINPYYLGLIRKRGDPIYRQCIPSPLELSNQSGWEDPLNEEGDAPIPGLTHRYPDRVLFLVSNRCAVYCRFCNRKRKVGHPGMVSPESIKEGLAYIRDHRGIRDVLLSGGDPLLLEDDELYRILSRLRAMTHVEIIRIGTRVPCTLPRRVTPRLAALLGRFHPLYIHTHFNHPRELTAQASEACGMLADEGIPLGSQTVLLRKINDRPRVMKELMQRLVALRVRPYYLFQADLVRGTAHFWTPLGKGREIIAALHGHTSGLCVPHYAVDLPGGGGKVPLLPEYLVEEDHRRAVIKNFRGIRYRYPLT